MRNEKISQAEDNNRTHLHYQPKMKAGENAVLFWLFII